MNYRKAKTLQNVIFIIFFMIKIKSKQTKHDLYY